MDTQPESESDTRRTSTSSESFAPADGSQDLNVTPSLEPFYERLLSTTFTDSASALQHCRDLCTEFGFTVKQEASTHKNIYIYCSREGLPDSQRHPKQTPKRKRSSKRCNCPWRVVLFERDGQWKFRKSLNPRAAEHNHPLLRPEEIETTWPKQVMDAIFELAKQRLSTQEIRTRVQAQYTHIVWNERRFYNRLSEARQKIKQQEAAARACHLTSVWSRVCMVTAGNEDMSQHVESSLLRLLQEVCQTTNTDPDSLVAPVIGQTDIQEAQSAQVEQPDVSGSATPSEGTIGSDYPTSSFDYQYGAHSMENVESTSSTQPESAARPNPPTHAQPLPPKGFVQVVIPAHSYPVKLYSQRIGNDFQMTRPSRHRSQPMQEEGHRGMLGEPRRISTRSNTEIMLPGQLYMPGRTGPSFEHSYHAQAQHAMTPLPTQSPTPSPFIYPPGYDTTGMPMQNYVHNFRHTYNMSPGTPGFGTPTGEMRLSFDSSSATPLVQPPPQNPGTGREVTMHSALSPNPMVHSSSHQQPHPPSQSQLHHHQQPQQHQHQHHHQPQSQSQPHPQSQQQPQPQTAPQQQEQPQQN